jgi:replicative DNA helicase
MGATDTRREGEKLARYVGRAIRTAGDELKRDLRELALYELPGRPYLPAPYDAEAEEVVLEALLVGRRAPSSLACCSSDFHVQVHRAAFAVVESMEEMGTLDGAPDLEVIEEVFRRFDADAKRAADYVQQLRDCTAFRFNVDAYAARVRELARRRRTMAAMQRVDAAWRSDLEPDALDAAAVVEALS